MISSKANKICIITIDGPSGAGKSTIAKLLARNLGYLYIDTGAMYRSVALKAMRKDLDLNDEVLITSLAEGISLEMSFGDHGFIVTMDGEDVSKAIRDQEVTCNASSIAQLPPLRRVLVCWQQKMAEKSNVVIEGRDAGTVVFPNADYKFYLDANIKERVSRRYKELRDKGEVVDKDDLTQNMKRRDHKDMTRSDSPLKMVIDSIVVDSTHLSVEESVDKLIKLME